MNQFEKYGYVVVKNAISKDMAKLLTIQMDMMHENRRIALGLPADYIGHDTDSIVPQQSWSWFGAHYSESTLLFLQDKMEEVVGKTLYPTYSYSRIYYNGSFLPRHVDRKSSQFAATLTISTDGTDWPIWIKDAEGNEKELLLDVGDMCVYNGPYNEHWRHKYTGSKQHQLFLFYVDANGEYAMNKFDRRPCLGSPGIKYDGF